MKIDVESSDDLVPLYAAYIELVDSGQDTTLELSFAPGEYGRASIGPINLDLGGNPPPRDPKVDLILRGRDLTAPVVLRDLGIVVNARSLHLENLVLTGRQQRLLQARVSHAFTMRNCVVANNAWGGPWGGSLIQITGIFGQQPYSAWIEDCWFVRNDEQSAAALLSLTPATGSFVEYVELARVAFIDNRTAQDLDIHEAHTIKLDEVIAIKQAASGVVLRYARSNEVLVERSQFVVEDPSSVIEEDTSTWRSGAELRASELHVWGASRTMPSCVRGAIEMHAALPLHRGALDEVIAALSNGVPTSAADARTTLRQVAGIP